MCLWLFNLMLLKFLFIYFSFWGLNSFLGIVWLWSLGPVTFDFSVPCMTLALDNQLDTITGKRALLPTYASFQQFCSMVSRDTIAAFHLLSFESPLHSAEKTISDSFSHVNHSVQSLLHQFSSIFDKPHGLPPPRDHDHKIPLLVNSQPLKVKPYRYPHV